MNVYILKKYVKFLIEKLKEIDNIDDYYLDGEQLDKERLTINYKGKPNDAIHELIKVSPNKTIISGNTDCPGKGYILCVGECSSGTDIFDEKGLDLAIVTVKENNKYRFNAWIHIDDIFEFYQNKNIKNYSSINGKFEKETYFVIKIKESNIEEVSAILDSYFDNYILRDNKVYVKIKLEKLSEKMGYIIDYIERLDVLDKDDF